LNLKLPKILVFTVTYEGKDYVFNEWKQYVDNINYPKNNWYHLVIDNSENEEYTKKLKNLGMNVVHIQRGNNSREAITRAQKYARRYAIQNGYDYILSLESDVLVPPSIIQDLLKSGKPIISALYMIGDRSKGVRVPCIALSKWNSDLGAWGTRLLEPEEWKDYLHNGLKQVHTACMGVCLISKEVFNKIDFYYDSRYEKHSDVYYFNDCFINRIPVWVDTDIFCDHKNVNWSNVKDR